MTFTVPLSRLIHDFSLEEVYLPRDSEQILIRSADVNRPGLYFAGFHDFFDNQRLQMIGKTETGFLGTLPEAQRLENYDLFFKERPPAVIVTRGLAIGQDMMDAAMRYQVPLLRTGEGTSSFMAGLIGTLNVELAPRVTRHGVFVEVYGEGLLLLGESGVGKSETAIELIKRGHRLIADDAVEIRRVSNRTLVGQSPENIRHFMELRGIGIINARRLFGMGAVKITEKIDIVVQMEPWDQGKNYDRLGLDNEMIEILGISVPCLTIPVKPGRNLAIILEVAAMNNRQTKMGYNAAQELLDRLGQEAAGEPMAGSWDF